MTEPAAVELRSAGTEAPSAEWWDAKQQRRESLFAHVHICVPGGRSRIEVAS